MGEYDPLNIIPVLVGGCLSVRQQHMTNISTAISDLPPGQRAIRDRCFHPTGKFIEFKKEEIEQSIPDRFEQMAGLYPDRLAVKTKNHAFTYDELNKAANRVACAILSRRGKRDEPIVLLLEKGAEQIAAILGVLKSGNICVSVEPSIPRSRIVSILQDSQPGLLVTDNENVSLASELVWDGRLVINIDEKDGSLAADNPYLSTSPDALAFIVYTSGSTGDPKGITRNHRNMLHNTMTHTNTLHICKDDRWTALRSFSTGGALNDIFNVLLNGAASYPFDIKKEGLVPLTAWLIQEEVTIYSSVATVYRHFVSTLSGERFRKLRLINLGGEAIHKSDVELYTKHFDQACLFVSRMGSSETGTVSYYFVDKKTPVRGNLVPVGYPAEDMEILLLDDGRDVGFNHVGEIAIKSRYLSTGYCRRPDLTRARFLPDPKGGDHRICLTGDLGRMLEDGCLEYLGRKDFRVKVRGYWIEIAEIEMVLLDHAAAKEAVVVAREDRPGDKRLVAYIVPTGQPAPTVNELRGFLKQKLPEYMIPSAFVMLDALPLTPTGKVDRRALPIPSSSRPKLDTLFVAPGNSVEEELAEIWAEVVGVDQVGIHDNFFDLGGHSLAATRVISRVINSFKVELPIEFLFESPTVAKMAQIVVQNQAKKVGPEDLARMLTELETLSDEEARERLADEGTKEDSEK